MNKTLYIPELGDELKLTKDWTFDLYGEYRNSDLWKQVTGRDFNRWSYSDKMKSVPLTLPKNTVLAVDRIYIRKGASEFSSLSFRIVSHPQWKNEKNTFGSKYVFRFWAKLKDCNTIEFEQVKDVTKEIKITKWDYPLCDIQKVGHHSFDHVQLNVERTYHIEGFGYIKDVKVIKMTIDYDVEWTQQNGRTVLGMVMEKIYNKKIKNVKYSLFDMDNNLIGEYKTFSTAKTNAKKHIQNVRGNISN